MVGLSPLTQTQLEDSALEEGGGDGETPLPTSSFGVIKRCFVDHMGKEDYENLAGNYVLKEIFGVSFYGQILSAKKAADEVGSSFVCLETPSAECILDSTCAEVEAGGQFHGLVSNLVHQKISPLATLSPKRFCLSDESQLQMVKTLSLPMDQTATLMLGNLSSAEVNSQEIQLASQYNAPPFAMSIYPLLMDLRNIFSDVPSIGKALAHAQKMLFDVNRGECVGTRIISEVYAFRIAVEGLRTAQNNAGRLPIDKRGISAKIEFSELKFEDRLHALFVQALRSQAEKFRIVVAVVDASVLAGLRKHWNTPLCPKLEEFVGQLVTNCEVEGDKSNHAEKKWLLTDKPVVAVGAGATAVLGASSFSKVIPASTLIKVMTLKVPASLRLFLTQTFKTIALKASSGAKTTSFLKATASTKKIRAVAHSVIASAEKTSFSAMKTAFYEIMRTRRVRPVNILPWATFACSVGTCAGLLMYGDGIEYAAESLPSAPSIACLGRGIQNLHKASKAVRQRDGNRIPKCIESGVHRLKK